MKKSFLWLLATAPLAVCAQTKPYTLTGELKNIKEAPSKVFLWYAVDGKPVTDSATVTAGKYAFKGDAAQPVNATLILGAGNPRTAEAKNTATVFLEAGALKAISIDSFSNITVKGGAANTAYDQLKKEQKPVSDQMQALMGEYRAAYEAKNEEKLKTIEARYDSLDELSKAGYESFLKKNPTTPIALYVIRNWMPYDIDVEKLDPIFNKLPEATKSSASGKALQAKLEVAKKTSIGKEAPDFTMNDTLGNPVKLSSLRGKYVLLDFWASWCGPCRRENPNVVKAFNEYKDKGFTVLGVSLDQPTGKEKWLKAIHDDGLTWTHLSDLQFWNNAAAKEYGVQAIPQNFLIDPQGKIAGKNLRGEDLEKKLAELIKG
ncbi:TlpA disulfide reductase family protein [Filimonas lacunae]|nr:TlpA disulfide reductase family protein [Filimonas lacunae]BAV10113.1 thiol:disulfide interchange protein [Filimonas lacunae]